MNQVTTQRPGRASSRGIFADINAEENSGVRARVGNLDRLAREGVATGAVQILQHFAALKNIVEQRLVYSAMTEIGKRSNRHEQHRVAGRDRLNRQTLV